jgi:hypothetical protein
VQRPIWWPTIPGQTPAASKDSSTKKSVHRDVSQEPPTPTAGPHAKAEVRKDVLETTRHQLIQALELDPANAKAHAMLLVTHYRLGKVDAVMNTLRHARNNGIPATELRAVPRCVQLVMEEMQACRLPMDLHNEFMEYLG